MREKSAKYGLVLPNPPTPFESEPSCGEWSAIAFIFGYNAIPPRPLIQIHVFVSEYVITSFGQQMPRRHRSRTPESQLYHQPCGNTIQYSSYEHSGKLPGPPHRHPPSDRQRWHFREITISRDLMQACQSE